LRAGANAVLDRASAPEAIFAAVRSAAAGTVVMPAAAAARVVASHPPASVLQTLSARERQVLRLVAQGLANDEIARELVVTSSTVKNHVARVMEKLGARNRTHAAVMGAGLGSG
jgi:DNA-binding NarL/FixJ family response regulator